MTEPQKKGYGPGPLLNPKGIVAYRPAPDLAVRCGACAYFDQDCRRCQQVAGEIEADMTCALFGPRRAGLNRPDLGLPTSTSSIMPLDIPTLSRMDLYRAADVRAGFVSQDPAGGLVFDADENVSVAWLADIVKEARRLTGNTQGAYRVDDGIPGATPLLDLLVEGDTARLVAHCGRLEFAVAKADDEKRYTLGPLYSPDTVDAHGDFVTPDTLQEAAWGYVRESIKNGTNVIFDQHTDKAAGEWVDLVTWPYEQTVTMAIPGEGLVERTFPAGTVYQGVIWSPTVWEEVKSGAKRGLSLGGMAVPTPVSF